MIPTISLGQFGLGRTPRTVTAVFDPAPLPDATVGVLYEFSIVPSGGLAPYTLEWISGPDWIFDGTNFSTFEVSATPDSGDVGTPTVSYRIIDADGNQVTLSDTLEVVDSALDVTEYFSAQVYTGNGADPRLIPGIDLSNGGFFVQKIRLWHEAHFGWSTGGGNGQIVPPNSNAYSPTSATGRFVSGGFNWASSVAAAANFNHSSAPSYVMSSFKKGAGFVDVVDYTGTGTAQDIAHSLGAAPAMIIIKRRAGGGGPLTVYHVDAGNNTALSIEGAAATSGSGFWDNTTPSATHFRVGASSVPTNNSGYLYSAILFAHVPAGIIQGCSWTGDGTANGPIIDLGWEPQFVMAINAASGAYRNVYDTARDAGFASGRRLPFSPPDSEANVKDFTLYNSGGVIGFRVHHTDANGLNVNGRNYYALVVREP